MKPNDIFQGLIEKNTSIFTICKIIDYLE